MRFYKLKVSIYYFLFKKDFGVNCRLYGIPRITYKNNVSFGKNTKIGDNVYIQGDGGVKIGDDVNLAYGTTILSAKYNLEAWVNHERKHEYNLVIIGNHVAIGANTTIQPGVKIEDNIVIAPGSVVVNDLTESYSMYGGIPARKIKDLKGLIRSENNHG